MYMKKYISTPDVSLKSSLKVDIFPKKGVWIVMNLRTVEIESHDGYKTESYMLYGNPKDRNVLVKPMQRYSAKTYATICEKFANVSDVDYLDYYNNMRPWQAVWVLISNL